MRRAYALVVALVLALTGCAALPTSGPVYVTAKPVASDGKVAFRAQSPAQNATPEEIVQGFMAAAAVGFSDYFAVAREFLSDSAVTRWDPRAQVRIYPDAESQSFSRAKTGAVRFTASAQASVDAAGEYQTSATDATIVSEFSLVRNSANQWRIAALDNGVIMPDSLFSTIFRNVSVYFVTPGADALVPVSYYFPEDRAPTAAITALLAGPPSWLTGAVRSAVPKGTSLATPQVDIVDQVANVNLTSEAAGLHDLELARMVAQFKATLKGVGGINSVNVSSGGALLETTASADIPIYPYGQYPLIGLANGEIHESGSGQAGSVALALPAGLTLTALAQSYEQGGPVIGLAERSRAIYSISDAGMARELVRGSGALLPPSTDRFGYVWSGAAKSDGKVFAVPERGGRVLSFQVPVFAGTNLRAIRVSRDGARMMAVADANGVSNVYMLGVVRDADGVPSGFADIAQMGVRLTSITDVAWIDEQTVVVIGTEPGATDAALYTVPIFGPMKRLPGTFVPKSLTAGRGVDSLIVESGGDLLEFDSGAWRKVTPVLSQPAYPG
ncbi:hypothetical protein J2S49_001436 [Arcanobacterium wilhelmae]|uniref:GerMN domain-containing protein n=1 Tax=Arcanobacterium wilhelmae TaxID=1803177 RepID=A0ABT9NCX2_9ACTO|nr:LpqB family beta-propeller domain-containing protein [Arcanobacterium wilhelmae]MDP9801360.1 hypothetical protein [Arcanobacterium wilhelmae]WFN90696.1 LpqB family beta-propeller domain-containing protein [Arcanobacterium wilhelmae]